MSLGQIINPDGATVKLVDGQLVATALGASGGSHSAGIAPDPGASSGSTKFLREDATWAVPSGGGGSSANPSASGGLSAVNGTATTFMTSDSAPALSQAIAPTWTGSHTFSKTAGTGTQSPTLTINLPAHTALTASTESPSINVVGATQQWATGTLTLQRCVRHQAPTIAFAGASTCTTAINTEIASPIAGTNATLTNSIALRLVASSAAHVPLVVQGAGSQSGNLLSCQNSSGTTVGGFSSAATVLCNDLSTVGAPGIKSVLDSTSLGVYFQNSSLKVGFGAAGSFAAYYTSQVSSTSTFTLGNGASGLLGSVIILQGNGLNQTMLVATAGSPAGNTASTEYTDVNFILTNTAEFATGAVALNRTFRIQPRTYSAVGASTITDAATFDVGGPPIAGSNVTLTRAWAARFGGRSGVLAGTSTHYGTIGGTLFDHFTDSGSTHTDGTEDTLYTDTIEASALATNGDKIEAEYCITLVSSATATREIKAYFGGTLILDSGSQTFASAGTTDLWILIIRVSATEVRVKAELVVSGISLQPLVTYTDITGLTLSSSQIIKVTGIAAGTGAASGDITARLGTIGWKSAA
jgi:hypothetical protein